MKYIINDRGLVIFQGENAGYFDNGLCPVQQTAGGKMGFINTSGIYAIPAIYDSVGSFENGVALVRNNGKIGAINRDGKVIIPLIYDNSEDVPRPHDGVLCIHMAKYKTMCIDVCGNELFTIDAFVNDFSEGMASIKTSNAYGVIDINGRYVVPLGKFDYISDFKYGVARVQKGYKWGFINRNGETIVPIKYDSIYGEPYIVVTGIIGDAGGYIDVRNGKEIIPVSIPIKNLSSRCVDLFLSTDNMVRIQVSNDETVFYNLEKCSLTKISALRYNASRYSEGLCCVQDKNTGKIGFIDKNGAFVIPCVFEEANWTYEFHFGSCAMGCNMIDRNGNILRTIPKGERIHHMADGYYHHYTDKPYSPNHPYCEYLLNSKGEIIYKGYAIKSEKTFPLAVKEGNNIGNKWGFIDKFGNIVIPYQFIEPYTFYDGFATIDEPIRNTTTIKRDDDWETEKQRMKMESKQRAQKVKTKQTGCFTILFILALVAFTFHILG